MSESSHSKFVTRRLAEVLAASSYDDLPTPTVIHTHRAILDWLGSALAGSIEAPARMTQRIVAGLGKSDEATVFAAGRSSAVGAALANGVASHILEFDDVHKGSTLHAAAPVISAALAVAEREHADGRAFMLAVALGYEAALRIGEAVNPSHYRYWHPTGTAATFGAAAAAGSLLKLTADQMLDALGSAGTQAAGLWEFNADGAMSKHLHPGKAALNGILAADLARLGFTGATRILEGDRGFFRAMSESFDASRITDGLGEQWKIGENCYKMYSCCGHTHTAIDVALDLVWCPTLELTTAPSRSRLRISASEPRASASGMRDSTLGRHAVEKISGVHIHTYGPGFEIVKEMNPRSPYQGKFSLSYCVAAALLEGRVGLEQFSPERFSPDGVRAPAIASLLERTRVTVEKDLTAQYPAAWPARVEITLNDGTVLSGSSDYPRGNPENPVSTAGLEEKLRGLIEPRFGEDTARRAMGAVHLLDSANDMSAVFRSLP